MTRKVISVRATAKQPLLTECNSSQFSTPVYTTGKLKGCDNTDNIGQDDGSMHARSYESQTDRDKNPLLSDRSNITTPKSPRKIVVQKRKQSATSIPAAEIGVLAAPKDVPNRSQITTGELGNNTLSVHDQDGIAHIARRKNVAVVNPVGIEAVSGKNRDIQTSSDMIDDGGQQQQNLVPRRKSTAVIPIENRNVDASPSFIFDSAAKSNEEPRGSIHRHIQLALKSDGAAFRYRSASDPTEDERNVSPSSSDISDAEQKTDLNNSPPTEDTEARKTLQTPASDGFPGSKRLSFIDQADNLVEKLSLGKSLDKIGNFLLDSKEQKKKIPKKSQADSRARSGIDSDKETSTKPTESDDDKKTDIDRALYGGLETRHLNCSIRAKTRGSSKELPIKLKSDLHTWNTKLKTCDSDQTSNSSDIASKGPTQLQRRMSENLDVRSLPNLVSSSNDSDVGCATDIINTHADRLNLRKGSISNQGRPLSHYSNSNSESIVAPKSARRPSSVMIQSHSNSSLFARNTPSSPVKGKATRSLSQQFLGIAQSVDGLHISPKSPLASPHSPLPLSPHSPKTISNRQGTSNSLHPSGSTDVLSRRRVSSASIPALLAPTHARASRKTSMNANLSAQSVAAMIQPKRKQSVPVLPQMSMDFLAKAEPITGRSMDLIAENLKSNQLKGKRLDYMPFGTPQGRPVSNLFANGNLSPAQNISGYPSDAAFFQNLATVGHEYGSLPNLSHPTPFNNMQLKKPRVSFDRAVTVVEAFGAKQYDRKVFKEKKRIFQKVKRQPCKMEILEELLRFKLLDMTVHEESRENTDLHLSHMSGEQLQARKDLVNSILAQKC